MDPFLERIAVAHGPDVVRRLGRIWDTIDRWPIPKQFVRLASLIDDRKAGRVVPEIVGRCLIGRLRHADWADVLTPAEKGRLLWLVEEFRSAFQTQI